MLGMVFDTKKSGKLTVTGKDGNLYKCRFNATGFETTAQYTQIKRGYVKDKMIPSLFGVGFIGDGRHSSKENGLVSKCYMYWHGMHRRCYDSKYHAAFPSYMDCSVCKDWHNYQNFCEWYASNKPKDNGRWELDKDIKINGNRQYSPEACKFVRSAENNQKRSAKTFQFKSPSGDVTNIYNLNKFCRENGLQSANMYKVLSGKYTNHKGWTKI